MRGDRAVFEVEDTGVGIAPEHHQLIACAHGGAVSATSNTEGTEFRVTLPLARPAVDSAAGSRG